MLLTNHTKGVQRGTKTAKTLGFSRNTVLARMKRYFEKGLKSTIIYIKSYVVNRKKILRNML